MIFAFRWHFHVENAKYFERRRMMKRYRIEIPLECIIERFNYTSLILWQTEVSGGSHLSLSFIFIFGIFVAFLFHSLSFLAEMNGRRPFEWCCFYFSLQEMQPTAAASKQWKNCISITNNMHSLLSAVKTQKSMWLGWEMELRSSFISKFTNWRRYIRNSES